MIITFASAIRSSVYQFCQFYTILQNGFALAPYHIPIVAIDHNKIDIGTGNYGYACGDICMRSHKKWRRCWCIGHCAIGACGGGTAIARTTATCSGAAAAASCRAVRIVFAIRTKTKWQNHCAGTELVGWFDFKFSRST